jgi:uncharacterized membrane protein
LCRPEAAASIARRLFFTATLKATLGSSLFSAIVASLFPSTLADIASRTVFIQGVVFDLKFGFDELFNVRY